jgi:hypothetical protein
VDHAIEDQARDQRLGFLVPMRLAALPCGIVDQASASVMASSARSRLSGSSRSSGL